MANPTNSTQATIRYADRSESHAVRFSGTRAPNTAVSPAYAAKIQRQRYTPGRSAVGRKMRYSAWVAIVTATAIHSHSRAATNHGNHSGVSKAPTTWRSRLGSATVATRAPQRHHAGFMTASKVASTAASSKRSSIGAQVLYVHSGEGGVPAQTKENACTVESTAQAVRPGCSLCHRVETTTHAHQAQTEHHAAEMKTAISRIVN